MRSPETNAKAAELFKSGRKSEAIQLLMDAYKIDATTAEHMVSGFEKARGLSDQVSYVRSIRDKIFGYILGPIGIILLIWAGVSYFKDQEAAKTSLAITGTVIELKKKEDITIKDGREVKSDTYAVVIEYLVNEKRYVHQPDIYSDPPLFQLNEAVPLLVDPTNPEKVIINSLLGRYSSMFGLLVFGAILTFIGARSLLKRS
jgi:hypothetical protein